MISFVTTELARNARRLGFVAVLSFLAGLLFYGHSGFRLFGVPLPLVAGAYYAAFTVLAAAVTCVLFPGLRAMVEAFAIARLVIASVVFAHPDLAEPLMEAPELLAGMIVALGYVVSRSLHGRIERAGPKSWLSWLVPGGLFDRQPLRTDVDGWKRDFVAWIDGREPVPVEAGRP